MILRILAAHPFREYFLTHFQEALSYEKALLYYQNNRMLIGGNWAFQMSKLGFPAIDVIADFMPLQEKWASEHGLCYRLGYDRRINILLSQIAYYKPEVIYFVLGGFTTISLALRRQLKKLFPFIRMVCGQWGDQLPLEWSFADFCDLDLVFGTYQFLLDQFTRHRIKSVFLPYCFDSNQELMPTPKQVPFLFCGSTGWGTQDHQKRYFDLQKLLECTDLELWVHEPNFLPTPWKRVVKRMIRKGLKLCPRSIVSFAREKSKAIGGGIARAFAEKEANFDWSPYSSLTTQFPSRCHPPVFGQDYLRLLQSAHVVFNRHRDETTEYANIRMFEVTGVGSCLLTDRGRESASLFIPDEEIVTYESIEEAIEKYKYLISHEKERSKIALAGQRRTLKDHTLFNHCKTIIMHTS